MKAGWVCASVAALAVVCAASAAAHGYSAVRVAAYVAPPLPVVVYPVVPVERQWMQGHWEWNGEGHVWVPGHWQLPPRAYAKAND